MRNLSCGVASVPYLLSVQDKREENSYVGGSDIYFYVSLLLCDNLPNPERFNISFGCLYLCIEICTGKGIEISLFYAAQRNYMDDI